MNSALASWQFWALLSAAFAALTAIFAKVGVENINSDFATLIRTAIILAVLGVIIAATRQFQPLGEISMKTWGFLTLSGLATGASWLCYFRALKLGNAAQVAPIDKAQRCSGRGVRRCLSGRTTERRELALRSADCSGCGADRL
jgi:transporter family protein